MAHPGRTVLAVLLTAVTVLPYAASVLCALVPTPKADPGALHHNHRAASHQEHCRACVNGPTLLPGGDAGNGQCALGECVVGTVATVPALARALPVMPPSYTPVLLFPAGISGEPAAPPTPPPVS